MMIGVKLPRREAATTSLSKLGILKIWAYEGGVCVRVLEKVYNKHLGMYETQNFWVLSKFGVWVWDLGFASSLEL
jgi:hypothetical protein